jgi:hypothetical protein
MNPIRWKYQIIAMSIAGERAFKWFVYDTESEGWRDGLHSVEPAATFTTELSAREWIEHQECLGGYAKNTPEDAYYNG